LLRVTRTYQGINIINCTNGFNISNGGPSALTTGGITVLDSTITNTKTGFVVGRNSNSSPATAGSLTIENVALSNVPTAIKYAPPGQPASTVLAGTTGSTTIGAWGSGNLYNPTGPTKFQGSYTAPSRPASLLSGNKYYTRSKPQYNTLAVSSFSSVKAGGAKGDGKTDDTAAIQNVINSAQAAGKVVYFDAGSYIVTGTINIPANSRVVGEAYATIMGQGSYFANANAPHPVVTVGHPGGKGTLEWSDMIVSTQGPSAGAILIQWNLAAPAGTPGGMWDVHTRIGGTVGSNLRSAQCPAQAGNPTVNPNCYGAYMLMQIAPTAAGVYMENCWLWTADHDVDAPQQTQITIYTGRGLLIESTNGPTWLVGTAVEHNEIYQYQFAHTSNIYAGQIQTETPYYQPAPAATKPYAANTTLDDPNWSFYCPNGQVGPCAEAWGLRIDQTSNVHIYGAGLYSFFSNYSTHCSDAGAGSDCQDAIFVYDQAHTTNLYVYNLNTIGSFGMVNRDTTRLATYSFNLNVFPSTIWFFRTN
jgi:glucan 1,3-beta-glucosidase